MKTWIWSPADEGRIKRAKSVKFSYLDTESDNPSGSAIGSGAEEYAVTLESCTCADFSIQRNKAGNFLPCKHMIALGIKAGLLNENGLTPSQQKEADISSLRSHLASAFGHYYLFNEPVVSDAEYDSMKLKYAALISQE